MTDIDKNQLSTDTDLFSSIDEKIKNHFYQLTLDDLKNLKQISKFDYLKVEQFCFDFIDFYFRENDIYLENEEDLTKIIDILLSYINPENLDEEHLFQYIFHRILVNRSKKENPEQSLELIDQYLPRFKKLQLRMLVEKAFIYHRDLNNHEKSAGIYNELLMQANKLGKGNIVGKFSFFIGQKYALMKDCVEAIKYYRKALDYYSNYVDKDSVGFKGRLHYEIGCNLDISGNYEEAIISFKRAKEFYENVGQNTGTILHHLGSIYHTLKNYDVALTYLEKAENIIDSRDSFFKADSVFLFAACQWELGNNENALEVLKLLISEYSDHPLINIYLSTLGIYYMHLYKYDEAITVISKAVKKLDEKDIDYKSTYIDNLTRIADCYLQKGEIQKSEQILDDLLNLYPEELNIIFTLFIKADCEFTKGRMISSLKFIKNIIKLNGKHNIQNNLFLSVWSKKAKALRRNIFKEHSIAYALLYPFM